MARQNATALRFIVSGPGFEEKNYAESGPAISAAVTAAERKLKAAGSVYVRDSTDDSVIVRVERDELGLVFIYTPKREKAVA